MASELPVLAFATTNDLERWLEQNHESAPGIWLKIAKKGSGLESVTYPEALELALCYGWIDGQKAALDDRHWLQRFTPRKLRSRWSRVNRERAEQLIGSGRMRPAGLREVEAAQADGRWAAAYEGQRSATVPDDLRAALARAPRALEVFEQLDSANRYAVLYRIAEAKRPETRARRIEKFVAMLAAGEKLHP